MLGTRLALASSDATKALLAVAILSLLVMLTIGLGALGQLFATFVTHRQAYFYVAPALLGMLVLVFFPFFYGITLSFTDSNLYNTSRAAHRALGRVPATTSTSSPTSRSRRPPPTAGGW